MRLLVGMNDPIAVSAMPDIGTRLSDDVESFYAAMEPHIDKMRRVAVRLAGVDNRDDVVQDALLRAWRARGQFDPAKGTLSAWLVAITAHQATRVRRRSRFGLPSLGEPEVGSEDAIDLRNAVTRLTPRERLAVDCF